MISYKRLALLLLIFSGLGFGCGKKPASQSKEAAFIALPASGSNFQYTALGKTSGPPSQISFTVKVCLQDIARLQPVIDEMFLVKVGAQSHEARTNSEGCIYWPETLDFRYYDQEKMLRFDRTIESQGVHHGTVSISFALDPWKGNGAELIDLRYHNLDSVKSFGETHSSTPPTLKITNVSYNYVGRDFELDHLLNLRINRHYQIRFSPVIYRNLDYTKGISYEPLRTGQFLLKVLLATNGKSGGLQPISFYKTPVSIIDGQVITQITLPVDFKEIPLLAMRNQLYLELSDTDQSEIPPVIAKIPFIALEASGSVGATEEVANNRVMFLGEKELSQNKGTPSSRAVFEQITHFRRPSDLDAMELNFSPRKIETISQNQELSTDDLSHFCILLRDQGNWLKEKTCRLFPDRYLVIVPTIHVVSVQTPPQEEYSDTYSMTVNAGFAHDVGEGQLHSQSSNWTHGIQWGASLDGGLNIFGNGVQITGGYKGSHDWVWSEVRQKSDMDSRFVNFTEMKNLAVERLDFGFQATVDKCFVVLPKAPASKGYHFCRNNTDSTQLHESWYYMNEQATLTNNALRDLANPYDAGWIKVVRGNHAFARIRSILKDSTKIFVPRPNGSLLDADDGLAPVINGISQVTPTLSDDNIPGTVE